MKKFFLKLGIVLIFFSQMAFAAPSVENPPIPKELESWLEFVKHKNPRQDCPILGIDLKNGHQSVWLKSEDDRQCLFAGILNVEIQKSNSNNFKELIINFTVRNDANSWEYMILPHARDAWPKNVKINNNEVEVFSQNKDGQVFPLIKVEKKSLSKISFSLSTQNTGTIIIPKEFGYISGKVIVDGVLKDSIYQPEGEFLKLQVEPVDKSIPDALSNNDEKVVEQKDAPSIEVYRFIEDYPIPRLVTVLRVQNSVPYRSIDLSGVLLEKELPIGVVQIPSDPRARFKMANKGITLTLPAGISLWRWDSVLGADGFSNLKTKPTSLAQFSSKEIWFIKSNANLRNLKVSGAPIDVSALPNDLLNLIVNGRVGYQAYQADSGKGILVEIGKGKSVTSTQEQLKHNSQIWVSFDGSTATYVQNLNAKKSMPGQWYVSEWDLQQVKVNNEPGLLFENSDKVFFGYPNGNFAAKIVATKKFSLFDGLTFPVSLVNNEDVAGGSWVLNLPAGWRALAVSGAGVSSDYSSGFWLNKFNLWDWFLLILIVWSGASVLGFKFAPLLLFSLLIGRLHYGAPFEVFLPIILIVGIIKRVPVGVFKKSLTVILAFLCLFLGLNLLSYTTDRIQKTIHVSLDEKRVNYNQASMESDRGAKQLAESAPMAPSVAMSAPSEASQDVVRKARKTVKNLGGRAKENALTQESKIAAQSGIGEPTWKWFGLGVNQGSTRQSGDKVKVWLLSADLQRILTVLGMLFFWIVFVGILLQLKNVYFAKDFDGEKKNV